MSGLLGKLLGPTAPPVNNYAGLEQQYRLYFDKTTQAGETPMSWQDFVKSQGGGVKEMFNPGGTPPAGIRMQPGNVVRG